METRNYIKEFNYDIKQIVSYQMRNYFTLSQDIDFKGFEVTRGNKTVIEKNPNSYNRLKLNTFAVELGMRERDLKKRITNLKQNYQLQYDDVPAEIPIKIDLEEIEQKFKEIVECVSIINVVRNEFKLIKEKIHKISNLYEENEIDSEIKKNDALSENTHEELQKIRTKYLELNIKIDEIQEQEIELSEFKTDVAIYNLSDTSAEEYVKAAVLSKLDMKSQLEYHQAVAAMSIYKQLANQYRRLSEDALDGDENTEQTIKVSYLTGNNDRSVKETKTTAKVIVSKKELKERSLKALKNVERFENIYIMVEEKTKEMINKMKEEILRQQKVYTEEKNEKILKYDKDKRTKIITLRDEVELLKQKFENIEANRRFEHQQKMNILEQNVSKLKAIIPIPDFTDKVINVLN